MAFATAEKIPAKEAKAKKPEVAEVHVGGLEDLAALDAVIANLIEQREALAAKVKDKSVMPYFARKGMADRDRPANFKGVEGNTVASCELKNRSAASALNPLEIQLLAKYEIPMDQIEDRVETFVFNPKYLADIVLMRRIERLLKRDKKVPTDLIMYQEAQTKTVVGKNALSVLFNIGRTRYVINRLLPILSTLSLKITKTDADNDLAVSMQKAQSLLTSE
jgi:hypothetical protein